MKNLYEELETLQNLAALRGVLEFYDYDEEKDMFFIIADEEHEARKPLCFE